jgi:RecB family endonuclease NucS
VLFEIERSGDKYTVSSRTITPEPVAELGLLEKDIEHWIADLPDIILPNEKILVIGQSIAGQSMADVLAIDEFGRLVIVEIKRSRTSRDTVAQLLGYAARMHHINYEELNAIAKSYSKWPGGELEQTFADFTDGARIP